MSRNKSLRLHEVIGVLNSLYPPALAEDWDNVGLQVGVSDTLIDKILICLDAEESALAQAEACAAQLVISHHPLIHRPLRRLTPADETGRVLFRAIRKNIAIVSLHTNLDRAADGLNDWLAGRLGLEQVVPLERMPGGDLIKLVVFVPAGHETLVMDALFAAGAGQIGAYDRCSFRVFGTGSFRPGSDTDPFIGRQGEAEEVEEYRLETILPQGLVGKVVGRMLKAHPYEEVAYDLVPLQNARHDVGLGRIGRLPQPLAVEEFFALLKQRLGLTTLRSAGPVAGEVSKIAVCGGSGASLFAEAQRQGADCLVTGDVKYHDAQRARSEGLLLIDAGHFGTEHLMVAGLAEKLRVVAADRQLPLEIIEMKTESDPFTLV
ncbi:MAG: Nif3-like dinuclear metal center hexameric protein [Desulfuromonas sp.]|nr:MAG: Nif3-like dinuclear metal center hexameric protein [Desulfuromonas sp.]